MVRDPTAAALSKLRAAYDLFRLEKQGSRLTQATILLRPPAGKFFGWLNRCCPGVRRFDDLDADALRPFTAELEGYQVDPRLLRMPAPRWPGKEMTVFHIALLRRLLAACACPVEELAVRILVGVGGADVGTLRPGAGGSRRAPNLMLDSLDRGHAELRIRWNAGAKGRRGRRVSGALLYEQYGTLQAVWFRVAQAIGQAVAATVEYAPEHAADAEQKSCSSSLTGRGPRKGIARVGELSRRQEVLQAEGCPTPPSTRSPGLWIRRS